MPPGGETGQALVKVDGADNSTAWAGVVLSDPIEDEGAAEVVAMVQIPQDDFEALVPRSNVLYVTTGENRTGLYLGDLLVAGLSGGDGGDGGGGGGGGGVVETLSPVMWFDFSDTSTVSSSGGYITEVVSKGTDTRSLLPIGGGAAYGVGINGLQTADFGREGHQSVLRNTSGTTYQVSEVWAVGNAGADAAFGSNRGLVSTATNNNFYFTVVAGNAAGAPFNFYQLNGVNSGASMTAALRTPFILRMATAAGSPVSANGGFQVGTDRNLESLNRGWPGKVGEVIVFSSRLSESDAALLYQHLSEKWAV